MKLYSLNVKKRNKESRETKRFSAVPEDKLNKFVGFDAELIVPEICHLENTALTIIFEG